MDIILKDFQFCFNEWKVDRKSPFFDNCLTNKYLIDSATGRRYLYESQDVVAFKCFLLNAFSFS